MQIHLYLVKIFKFLQYNMFSSYDEVLIYNIGNCSYTSLRLDDDTDGYHMLLLFDFKFMLMGTL